MPRDIKNSRGQSCRNGSRLARQQYTCDGCIDGILSPCFRIQFEDVVLPTGNGAQWTSAFDITSDVLDLAEFYIGPSGGPCYTTLDSYDPVRNLVNLGVARAQNALWPPLNLHAESGDCVKFFSSAQRAFSNVGYYNDGFGPQDATWPGINVGVKTSYDEDLNKYVFEVIWLADGHLMFAGRALSDDPIDCATDFVINNELLSHTTLTAEPYTNSLLQPFSITTEGTPCGTANNIRVGGYDGTANVFVQACCSCKCRLIPTNGFVFSITLDPGEGTERTLSTPPTFHNLAECGSIGGGFIETSLGLSGDYAYSLLYVTIHYGPDDDAEGCAWVRHIRLVQAAFDFGTVAPFCTPTITYDDSCWWKYISTVAEPTTEADWTFVTSSGSCSTPTITNPDPPDNPDQIPCKSDCADCGAWFVADLTFQGTGEDDEGFRICLVQDTFFNCVWFQVNPGNWIVQLYCSVNADNEPVWVLDIANQSGSGLGGHWVLHQPRAGQVCPDGSVDWVLVSAPPTIVAPAALVEHDGLTNVECSSFTRGDDCGNCDSESSPYQYLISINRGTLNCCASGLGSYDLFGVDATISKLLTQTGDPCVWEIVDTSITGREDVFSTGGCATGFLFSNTTLVATIRLTKTSSTVWTFFMEIARIVGAARTVRGTWTTTLTVSADSCGAVISTFSASHCLFDLTASAAPV